MDEEKKESLKLYILRGEDGSPISYAFGPSWVGAAFWMNDISFSSEDEAVLYWYHNVYKEGMRM